MVSIAWIKHSTTFCSNWRTQYLLGFYPQGVPDQPRLFHSVSVKVHGDGMRVTSRTGYYEP